jgi:hypothetical protein
VLGTQVEHNTTYQTGADSQGVVCILGCGPTVLTMRANIIWAETKVIYADGPVRPELNLLWSSDGTPFVQMERRDSNGQLTTYRLPASNIQADPRMREPRTGEFRPRRGSPAVDRDAGPPLFSRDIMDTPLPQGRRLDLGAIER